MTPITTVEKRIDPECGTPESTTRSGTEAPLLNSRELFAQHNQVMIDHLGERYVLRITRQGKLILTK
ncbi:MAG: hemin uptake protein HemP [Sedimenticola sp.]